MIKKLLIFGEKKIYYILLTSYLVIGTLVVIFSLNFDSFRFLIIKSNSMWPNLSVGSLILVKKEDEYQPGDIISFYTQNNGKEEIVTHRLIKIGGNVYITRGDANLAIDSYVKPRLVIGKVIFSLPYIGLAYLLVKNLFGVFVFIIFPAIFFISIEALKINNLFIRTDSKISQNKKDYSLK